jgi:octaprenyl-diphosphate synthase
MAFGKLRQALTFREVQSLVRDDLQLVEREISMESIASVDAITTIGRYLQDGGGKRLRPMLVLLAAKMVGEATGDVISLAAVVEMLHTATLAHDDVIDVAETRRGRPSPNVIWGNNTSVLAGDWLYMQAFQVALRQRNFTILDLLIGLTQRMVEGELLQLELIGSMNVTEADYMELVDRKTASLFSSCARLGGMAIGAGSETVERLGDFAWNLGMAFQLVDDVLDFTSREKVLGKPVGNDLREGKITLPLIYALEQADESERRAIEAVLEDSSYDRTPFASVREFLERRKGVERAMSRAATFTGRAREILASFPDNPYQRALFSVADLITERDH